MPIAAPDLAPLRRHDASVRVDRPRTPDSPPLGGDATTRRDRRTRLHRTPQVRPQAAGRVRRNTVSSRRITIFDTTLRDGEQAPGIALRPDEKVEIGEQLERLGVDVIEAGFAASSPGDFEGVQAVARAATRSRSPRSAARAPATSTPPRPRSRTRRARVSTSSSPRARCTWRRSFASGRTRSSPTRRPSVARACATRGRGRVLVRGRDALRSRRSSPTVCRAAVEAGATTINLPDTVGYMLPAEYASFIAARPASAAPSSTRSRSRRTATTTSGSPSRTRSRRSTPASTRSSARSTASASAPATRRSRRS